VEIVRIETWEQPVDMFLYKIMPCENSNNGRPLHSKNKRNVLVDNFTNKKGIPP
jgi:hypothetical protein